MARVPLPDANAAMVDAKTMAPTPVWYRIMDTLLRRFSEAEDVIPALSQETFGSWHIEFPDDKDYRLIINIPFAVTIAEVTTRSTSGTCTATVKINTTALGGTANSVSSSEQSQAHTTANAMAAGDDLVLTISSNASCEGMVMTIAGTRTLDV